VPTYTRDNRFIRIDTPLALGATRAKSKAQPLYALAVLVVLRPAIDLRYADKTGRLGQIAMANVL
jgi:hypothetical protein